MRLRAGPPPMVPVPSGRLDEYYGYLENPTEESIILEDGLSTPLAADPRPLDVLDRCGAFHLPSLSTQHTDQVNKAPAVRTAWDRGEATKGESWT